MYYKAVSSYCVTYAAHWLLKNLSHPHFLSNLQATFKSVLFLVFWSNSDRRRLLDRGRLSEGRLIQF